MTELVMISMTEQLLTEIRDNIYNPNNDWNKGFTKIRL